ncbi:uncharacterized protein PAC_07950 [Phialocephala subalpina]|uniref:Uncharacterized protein n=1 Tax=Phialocephala subalpina TaxID=576137 RepID=A0A1L7WZ75_9HELO|nr:uncharacterized protein PAC_07950 [Phialocephala subalpina]
MLRGSPLPGHGGCFKFQVLHDGGCRIRRRCQFGSYLSSVQSQYLAMDFVKDHAGNCSPETASRKAPSSLQIIVRQRMCNVQRSRMQLARRNCCIVDKSWRWCLSPCIRALALVCSLRTAAIPIMRPAISVMATHKSRLSTAALAAAMDGALELYCIQVALASEVTAAGATDFPGEHRIHRGAERNMRGTMAVGTAQKAPGPSPGRRRCS